LSSFLSRCLRALPVLAVVVVTTGVAVWLRQGLPEWVIADAGHDDQLFVRGAVSVTSGNWLGPFDARTLLKGPGYSLWLVAAERVPLPLLDLQELLHVAVCGMVALLARRLGLPTVPALVTFVVLALDPTYLGAASSRIIRDDWYASWCLLLFASVGWAMVLRPRGRFRTWWSPLVVGVFAGGVAAWYWIGREERVWMAPPVLVLVGLLIWGWKRRGPTTSRIACVAPVLVALLVASLVGVGLVVAVMERNRRAYGAALVTDFADGQYVRAYGLWHGVEAGPTRRFVPISHAQRLAVYAVSPAAAELRPYLEGPLRDPWISPGCQAVEVCNDYAAGWFPFALRDAVASIGGYANAKVEQEFYARLADQIAAACQEGRLTCDGAARGLLPKPSEVQLGALVTSARHTWSYLESFQVGEPGRPESSGSPENYTLFASTIEGLPARLAEQQDQEARAGSDWSRVRGLVLVYRWATRFLVPIALLGYFLVIVRRPRGTAMLWILGAAAAAGVCSRVTLLALIDSTAFPAASTSYIMPATGLLLISMSVGVWLSWTTILDAWQVRRTRVRRGGSAPGGNPASESSHRD
jgi:hypothetical protein